jgi:hypothetical protein
MTRASFDFWFCRHLSQRVEVLSNDVAGLKLAPNLGSLWPGDEPEVTSQLREGSFGKRTRFEEGLAGNMAAVAPAFAGPSSMLMDVQQQQQPPAPPPQATTQQPVTAAGGVAAPSAAAASPGGSPAAGAAQLPSLDGVKAHIAGNILKTTQGQDSLAIAHAMLPLLQVPTITGKISVVRLVRPSPDQHDGRQLDKPTPVVLHGSFAVVPTTQAVLISCEVAHHVHQSSLSRPAAGQQGAV